ncbi:hypothetical protein NCC49_005405 [Naganishia albida]|nr:hypothetical protein NCC49_005405 [Naganishia albida]
MDDSIPVTGLQTSGSVSSRFVSQNELDEAKKRKDEEWKAAYARIGQEPPPQQEEEYDPRSLYERLSTQKEVKKEEWDAKMRMANQFRGLEADELQFLDETARVEREKQRKVEMQDAEQLAAFKKLQSKQGGLISPPLEMAPPAQVVPSAAAAASRPPPPGTAPTRKNVKSLLKGVIKKKDSKPRETTESGPTAPATKAPVSDQPASPSVRPAPESNNKKRPAPAPALGALGGYDSDSDASDASDGEPESKKAKV